MVQPDSNRPPKDDDSAKKAQRTSDDSFNSLFHTLFAIPSVIYNRGNEHGRAFTRRYQNEEDGVEEGTQPRGTKRGCSRWEERYARQQDERREQTAGDEMASQAMSVAKKNDTKVESKEDKSAEEWVEKVIGDLERAEREAKDLYEQWMTVAEDTENDALKDIEKWVMRAANEDSEKLPQNAARTIPEEKCVERAPWADIFPAWSSNQGVITKGDQNQKPHRPAKDVDDTIDKLHKDLGRWLGDADQWRQRFQRGYERDSRLWRDEGLFGPSFPLSRPLSTLFSLGLRPFLPEQSAMGYLLYSEYSPLHLEHEEGFDSTFRQRFEDLLRIEDGKPLLTKEECSKISSKSSVDWLGRVIPLLKDSENGGQGRVTIGSTPGCQSVLQVEAQQTPFDTSRQIEETSSVPETEQDMYEHHFATFPREHREPPATSRITAQAAQSQLSQPSVLSTLTTTERHVAPDGSVTTKTVLKKRFADGREQNSETIEITSATRPAWREQSAARSEVRPQPPAEDQPKKKGWFWSS